MTRLFSTFAAALIAFAMLAHPGFARDLTAAEDSALRDRIARFSATFAAKDMKALGDVIPPKVLGVMSEEFGLEPAALLAAMEQAMSQAMQAVEIDSYAMDVDAATGAETNTGRAYFLIPTQTRMVVDGTTKVEASSQTLAFEDEGVWYLVRIDDAQQVLFLTKAYPEFLGITFPEGSVKIVED